MSMTEMLEHDRERILYELSGEKTPAENVRVLTDELDRVFLRYNSEEENPVRRDTASHMIEAVKAFVPAVDCIGETKVWERTLAFGGEPKRKADGLFFLLLFIGLMMTAGAAVILLSNGAAELAAKLPEKLARLICALPVLGGVLLLLAGMRLSGKKKQPAGKTEQKLEIFTDADKLYRTLHAVTLVMDRELEAIVPAENRDGTESTAVRELSDAELELYASLLEAGYASEDETMDECMESLRYYLHKSGIETVDYSEAERARFELMPGQGTATIRPALVKNEVLLRRGLATDDGRSVNK